VALTSAHLLLATKQCTQLHTVTLTKKMYKNNFDVLVGKHALLVKDH